MFSLRAVSLIEPHIYSFNNFVVISVEDSVGLRLLSLTKHITLMCFRCKFGSVMWIPNPTPCAEDFEITYLGFLTREQLIRGLFEEFVKRYPVDDVASSINSFRPPLAWCPVFIKHSACHLNKGSVLALHDAILLWGIWSR